MKRWIWFFAALVISTGVYFTIRYGLQPKPIPVLNATEFENPEQIGAVIYKRLRQDIRSERVILLGSRPELAEYQAVWTGFLKAAVADGIQIDVFFQRDGLLTPERVGSWELQAIGDAAVKSGEFMSQVKARMQLGHLLVVHASTSEVSHLVSGSFSHELESLVHHPVLAISTLPLGLTSEEMTTLQAQCVEPVASGSSRMGCAEARVGKILAKKHLLTGKLWAVMERHGLKEYLVFIHRPMAQP